MHDIICEVTLIWLTLEVAQWTMVESLGSMSDRYGLILCSDTYDPGHIILLSK
jgi:hypothetical protein